jgi:hypothetical protein
MAGEFRLVDGMQSCRIPYERTVFCCVLFSGLLLVFNKPQLKNIAASPGA